MQDAKIKLDVSFAWWLKPYLFAITVVAVLTRSEPDWGKLRRMIERAMRIRVA